MLECLKIGSPKLNRRRQKDWAGFFPYYAGYSEDFARAVLTSAKLGDAAVICDPWNGSGTTTYTASLLGLRSWGFDLNPVMVLVARARVLSPSEADSIEPLAREIVRSIAPTCSSLEQADPLASWFGDKTTAVIRSIERAIRERLVGAMTLTPMGTHLERISGLAATFYVSLFTLCRQLVKRFSSSNPTWLRRPKDGETKIGLPASEITHKLLENLRSMAESLAARVGLFPTEQGICEIRVADTAKMALEPASIDLVLTSPPYCTRIDYTAATRIELAVLAPLTHTPTAELGRQMLGSTRVPRREIDISRPGVTHAARF